MFLLAIISRASLEGIIVVKMHILYLLIIIIGPELAWLGLETNEFGPDEFLKWCDIVGTEPYFALNFGTGM